MNVVTGTELYSLMDDTLWRHSHSIASNRRGQPFAKPAMDV
jgi:hypothetical protein